MHITHLLPDLFLNKSDFEVARFIEKNTANGNHKVHLYKNGHVFYRTSGRNTIHWLCKSAFNNRNGPKCTAKATTKGIKVLAWNGHHNHGVIEPSKKKQYIQDIGGV